MAVIAVSFDTKSKKMSCAMDGADVPNVVGVSLGRRYGSDEKYSCEMVQWEESEADDYGKMTRVVASALADPAWTDAAIAGFKLDPAAPPKPAAPEIDETALAAEWAAFRAR